MAKYKVKASVGVPPATLPGQVSARLGLPPHPSVREGRDGRMERISNATSANLREVSERRTMSHGTRGGASKMQAR